MFGIVFELKRYKKTGKEARGCHQRNIQMKSDKNKKEDYEEDYEE
jgi:hypothetical protein